MTSYKNTWDVEQFLRDIDKIVNELENCYNKVQNLHDQIMAMTARNKASEVNKVLQQMFKSLQDTERSFYFDEDDRAENAAAAKLATPIYNLIYEARTHAQKLEEKRQKAKERKRAVNTNRMTKKEKETLYKKLHKELGK